MALSARSRLQGKTGKRNGPEAVSSRRKRLTLQTRSVSTLALYQAAMAEPLALRPPICFPPFSPSAVPLWIAGEQPRGYQSGVQRADPELRRGQMIRWSGSAIGGVNVFGGGLALYDSDHNIVGAIGVSGDTSCADHNIAWRTRHRLNLDHLGTVIVGPAGLFAGDPTHPDNIIYDITANPAGGTGNSASGFGHPSCFKQTTDLKSLRGRLLSCNPRVGKCRATTRARVGIGLTAVGPRLLAASLLHSEAVRRYRAERPQSNLESGCGLSLSQRRRMIGGLGHARCFRAGRCTRK